MKRLSLFFLAVVIFTTVGCMKKRRVGTSDLQSNISSPSDRDSVCPGGVNVFIRPVQAENTIITGQKAKFEILASGCLHGYGLSVEGRFLPFNPGTQVDVTMPLTPEPARIEEFSIVAFDSSGTVHRGPYLFDSTPFNLSAGSSVNLNFLPSQTISVEGRTIKLSVNASEPTSIQRIYSDEAGYISAQPQTPFTLAAGEWRELTLQLSRGTGGTLGGVKFDYLVKGSTQTAQLTVNHNVCTGSFEDDFFGSGSTQALTYRCADGLIRVSLNLSEQLVSSWPVPTGYSLKDIMHGRIDTDTKADLLFFATKSNEPRKGYFFYGRSQASQQANTAGGSFNVVPCSGSWDAPPSTTLPNQFLLEPESGGVSAKIYTIQSGGVRYQSLLSVGDNTCSLGTVQLAPPSTFLSVSDDEVDPGENFIVVWAASNVTGFQCRLEKKLASASTWTLVGSDNLPSSGSMVLERTETQSINATTDYRAVCKKTENGITTTIGGDIVRTIEVNACQMQAAGATSSDITVDSKNYRLLTFSQVGDHSLSVSGNCNDASILVVGGGGGGGGHGGGGGGGLLYLTNQALSSGTYNISVGPGGSGGTNGGNSSIIGSSFSQIAKGGGGGAAAGSIQRNSNGKGGGSGGGAGSRKPSIPGSGTRNQGHSGGKADYIAILRPRKNRQAGGGGGGAGGPGGDAWRSRGYVVNGGNGGKGRCIDMVGRSVCYAGGGGAYPGGSGGTGGGGNGYRYPNNPTPGSNALGGGGGGGIGGSSGGSGVVIIRYELP